MAGFVAIFGRRAQAASVPLAELADEDLMERYAGGEVEAFAVLLERHKNPVYSFVLRSCRRPAQAEELVQEVWLRVVRQADSYQRRAKFTTWLYTIARNLCIDHSRKMRHRQERSLDEPLGGDEDGDRTLLGTVADDRPGADGLMEDEQFAGALYAALEELPPEQREVFLMRERQNLKFREIADIVGIPENTVKSRMRYALEFLRRRLAEHREPAPALK